MSADWWASSNPEQLWDIVFPWDCDEGGHPSARKARLFGCACWRRAWHALAHPALRRAVEAAEDFADASYDTWDGLEAQRAAAKSDAARTARQLLDEAPLDPEVEEVLSGPLPAGVRMEDMRRAFLGEEGRTASGLRAAEAVCTVVERWGDYLEGFFVRSLGTAALLETRDWEAEMAAQANYLRCLFLPWPGGRPKGGQATAWPAEVVALAGAAYHHRHMPAGTLEPDRLAVLADAVEDAGRGDEALLSHLRSPGPHVRGCWALDLILGKE